jgi:hypothetical protein
MIDYIKYARAAYTHYYIVGVGKGGKVTAYFINLHADGLSRLFTGKPQKSSGQIVHRYRSTRKKIAFLEKQCLYKIDLMSITDFETLNSSFFHNRGNCFEWLIAMLYNVSQNAQQNLSFRDGADLTIGGVPYQVKYEGSKMLILQD